MQTIKNKRKGKMLQPEVAQKWEALKQSLNFRSDNEFANALLETQKDRLVPFVSHETVFNSPAPTLIIGEPGSRKTTLVKQLIPSIRNSILCIDPHSEYLELEQFNGKGEVVSKVPLGFEILKGSMIDFSRKQRLRFIPSQNPFVSEAETTSLFMSLNESREKMKGWTLIVDECHRFSGNSLFRSFITESRKYSIKSILITADYAKFEGLGYFLRPAPIGRA
ncbi:MAG: hypothetical protein FJ358_08170 [Thaumarchaeota archaeon]|nr:hypothetical protein [Nitrososphaerota archaeon]